jgi:glycosyltransferase involved in cell wall biosynthesis
VSDQNKSASSASSPLLSVIIPVYNVEQYLRQCLDSVFDGTANRSRFEVIIVNDGSMDGAAAIIDEYYQRFENCVVIEQDNQGLSAARMKGLSRAIGEYVWFVDSDDWLVPDAIEMVMEMVHIHEGFSVYAMPIRKHEEESEVYIDDYKMDCPQIRNGWDLLLNFSPSWYYAQRFIIHRSLFEHPWLFFPLGHLREDVYFCRVLLVLAGTIFVSNISFYHYRSRPDSITNTITIRSSYDLVSIYSYLKAFSNTFSLSEKRQFMASCQWILSLCYKVNDQLWGTPSFRRFMSQKTPFLLCELIRNTRCYSFKEWSAMFLLLTCPTLFLKLFPSNNHS